MAISQEDKDNFEHNFSYLVSKYTECLEYYTSLLGIENRTEHEEQELLVAKELLQTIGNVLSSAMQVVGDDLFGKAIDMYYQYKEAAETGDGNAKTIVDELKPLFEASLNNRINNN